MRIRIMSEGDERSLNDLQSWLARNPKTNEIPVEPIMSGGGTTMGALEALELIVEHGSNLANFALAYATWRASRPGAGGLGAGNGARLLVHGDSEIDIGHLSPEELADLLRRLADDGQEGEL
ncbi:hypothetical protein [Streptomyces sp. NBC_00568]|uniref:effector-associated constant component EACC1 n=1 Tax=Streptomyces sp. NBC_00568 TaxID=2975779 RepID=UPI00224DA66E|nr:hypothetical protein [Streptomyces sp. NBC_00568]MCX4993555.1 hypothetical protein [Streptomyces sp. NBC_00568]